MILYCVLISFAFVNVFSEITMDYRTKAFITNELIRQACEITEGFSTIMKRIVLENQYSMEELAYMFAVPEYADNEGLNIFQCMKYERDVQDAIINGINSLGGEIQIEIPAVENLDLPRNVSLQDIGYNRRSMTKIHIKHLLSRVERRIEESFSPTQICYLTGLYKNSTIPRHENGTLTFIKVAKVNRKNICNLTSAELGVTYYKHIVFEIWQLFPDKKNKYKLVLS